MERPDLPHAVGFPWTETGARLEAEQAEGPLRIGDGGRWYERVDAGGRLVAAIRPPFLLLADGTLPEASTLGARAEEGLGRYAVLLLQAGAAALGLFEEGIVLDHKAIKRYVVRGKGRAQPAHLKTRGKSRQGSRLRLRNAERLLVEVSERLGGWFADEDPPARLFVSCPVRLYADLCRVEPPPPVLTDDPRRIRIPLDVHVPNHAELMRVHDSLARGRHFAS